MYTIENLQLNNYLINLEIKNIDRIGIFARDNKIVEEFMLILAGIIRYKGICLFNGENVYDNDRYFKTRIYLDCEKEYLKTLNVSKIYQAIKNKYQKKINSKLLNEHIESLKIRGECDITFAFEYKFTPTGNSLINLSLALAFEDNLLINNPTINITRINDLLYFKQQFAKRKGSVIFGINSLLHLKDFLDKIIFFTDFQTVEVIDPNQEQLLLVDSCDIIDEYKLYQATGKRLIIKQLPLEIIRRLHKQRIKIERISIYEIEKYLSS